MSLFLRRLLLCEFLMRVLDREVYVQTCGTGMMKLLTPCAFASSTSTMCVYDTVSALPLA